MSWLYLAFPAALGVAAFAICWQNAADRMRAMLDEVHLGQRTDDELDVWGDGDD